MNPKNNKKNIALPSSQPSKTNKVKGPLTISSNPSSALPKEVIFNNLKCTVIDVLNGVYILKHEGKTLTVPKDMCTPCDT